MASLKFRVDRETTENGQILGWTDWIGGASLARVKGCVCSDGVTRIAYVTGEPLDYWSLPGRVNVGKQSVKGAIWYDEDEGVWKFTIWNRDN
jgi:hypothetical protein